MDFQNFKFIRVREGLKEIYHFCGIYRKINIKYFPNKTKKGFKCYETCNKRKT